MNFNVEELIKLIDEKFDGNYTKFAKVLKIAPSSLCRIVNGNTSGGVKTFGNFIMYCKTNKLDYEKYIFFETPLHKSNI